jgi:DNA topoisomerase-1
MRCGKTARNVEDSSEKGCVLAKRAPSKAKKDDAGAVATAEAKPEVKGGGRAGGGRGRRGGPSRGLGYTAGMAKDRHLVIVESPSKAKTINKYLGHDYLVLASVGHVRDLPSKNPKGVKSPVPGVDLEHRFKPTYQVLEGKDKVVADLKRAAKESQASGRTIWFATDLDREGEAIAWHLAQELGIPSSQAKRVIFAAITKGEIERAFSNPHPIDEDRVNAQQARRILDRIVGYQVSPLLWKKVARGLSAGRVQSVAVRLVVDRERQIRGFVPDEEWSITGYFALTPDQAKKLGAAWPAFLSTRDEKKNPPTLKAQNAWLSDAHAIRAELVEFDGKPLSARVSADKILGPLPERLPELSEEIIRTRLEKAKKAFDDPKTHDVSPEVERVALACGLKDVKKTLAEDASGRGPARWVRSISGIADPGAPWRVESIETKRTKVRPPPPFITSTLQQAASSRLGFGAQRTMRAAQQLYEGVEVPGEGPVGLITYMRTDSTHLSGDALNMLAGYIARTFDKKYLPEKPNFFASSNKSAQEAHEAIRPTNVDLTPTRVKNALTPDQFRLYELIWQRAVACQMMPAEWDSTAVLIRGGKDNKAVFKATGRVLVFDGWYRVAGVPKGDELTLPLLEEKKPLSGFALEAGQRFSAPPARYSEASLIKMLESEGIGRPSTYASIISVIQDRAYVEQQERRFFATDLGEVVTDKLIEAFPQILDVGYTREMETQLDKVEEDHLDWIEMLNRFYGPFKSDLAHAMENLSHAKAETTPAPKEYACPDCGSPTVYRFGKNGRFLSCSRYPDCKYASPVDREGKPRPAAETVDIACPKCGSAMTRRVGRFGPFLGCSRYGDKTRPCDGILNIDRKGKVVAPSPPPLLTELKCPICESPLNLRNGLKGPWLGCSRFPKCRGRGKWAELPDAERATLETQLAEHEKHNRVPVIRTMSGKALTDDKGKPLASAPTVDVLAGKVPDDGAPETPNEDVEVESVSGS